MFAVGATLDKSQYTVPWKAVWFLGAAHAFAAFCNRIDMCDKLSLGFTGSNPRHITDPFRDERGCIELNCPNQLSSVPVDFPSGPRERL